MKWYSSSAEVAVSPLDRFCMSLAISATVSCRREGRGSAWGLLCARGQHSGCIGCDVHRSTDGQAHPCVHPLHTPLSNRPRTCRKRASSMRAPMRRFISSSFFSLSSNVEGSMLGNSLSATCGSGGGWAGEAGTW